MLSTLFFIVLLFRDTSANNNIKRFKYMDKRNLDQRVLAVFDHVGTFFVDIFYNSLYRQAEGVVLAGRAASITDAYRSMVINYMNGITQREDLYMKVVRQLHECYQKSSGFSAMVFSEFEDKVISCFIPPEYYRDFTGRHKDKTLHEVVVKSANDMGEFILRKDILRRVIDDRRNEANIPLFQDKMLDIFVTQREDYYARFVEQINKNNGNDKVSKKVLDKLKEAFVEEKKKCCELESERDRAVSMISQLVAKISQLENEIKTLREQKQRAETPKPTQSLNTFDIMGDLTNDSQTIRKRGRPKKAPVKEAPKPIVESEESSSEDEQDESSKRREMLMKKIAERKNQQSILSPQGGESESESESESEDGQEEPKQRNQPGNPFALDDDPWEK